MLKVRNLQTINLEETAIDVEAVKLIPEDIAVSNCLIAFKQNKDNLCIAVNRNLDIFLYEELKFITGKSIEFFYSSKHCIVNAVNSYYCKNSVQSVVRAIEEEKDSNTKEKKFSFKEEESLQQFPIVKLTNHLVNSAICKNASDIHLEPFQDQLLVRFRVDGIMMEFLSIPLDIYPHICTRLKIMASLNIAEKRVPQDGKIEFVYDNANYDLRISTLPTVYGEKIVVRILYKSEGLNSLSSLGFSDRDEKDIKFMLTNPHGILLVSGPTGSGKTTTLYSMLQTFNKKEKNITSIEDPVEYTVDNVNQVNVNNKIGFSFPEGLRSILRQDPDIIMIGEIRDEETAQIAIRAAVTGHLVISTIHTNDAAAAVLRLKDMGVPSYFIEDAVIGIIAQRLVRKICTFCKKEHSPTENEKEYLNLDTENKLFKGEGCNNCSGTGYNGRTIIYELIDFRELRKKGFKLKDSAEELRKFSFKEGIGSIRENCEMLVKEGITTFDELLRINL
ncbi:GspE/PulE family protein [Clostridium sp. A1-XYC3]|uniref:GspE/PulE family protein n=1 Tax=Clostridium tanneri TaxID=3037988 RepID=A0ABU4JN79_9CLOT|nr:GspE/PulE family protein [Clostridium sp. A1-XYC3]MDW8799603.1 GspE/PulE family protein [Clostridium sp. A1-XYC3]